MIQSLTAILLFCSTTVVSTSHALGETISASTAICSFRSHKILQHVNGIDHPGTKTGDSIVAKEDGKVIYTGWYGGYGRIILIKTNSYLPTLYAHLAKVMVTNDQLIQKGQQIGIYGFRPNFSTLFEAKDQDRSELLGTVLNEAFSSQAFQ